MILGTAFVVGLLAGAVAALAQPAPPAPPAAAKPNWEAIRKAALSPLDRGTVQKWITAEIDQIFAAEDPVKPGLEFSKEMITQARTPGSDAQYKDTLCQMVADAFKARYQQQPTGGEAEPNPLAPVFVLMTLREMGPPPVVFPAFRAVLGHAKPAVRCQGIMGLNVLRAGISAQNRAGMVDEIRKAAETETNPTVLGRMYDFLGFVGDNPSQPQDLQSIIRALIQTLETRLGRCEKEGGWPAAVDAGVVVWLAEKSKPLNNPQTQAAVVRTAARLVADAAYAFANLKLPQEEKQDEERIIVTVEPILADLLKAKGGSGTPPSPTVAEAIVTSGSDQAAKVAEAVAKWIGAGQTKGALNDAFALPVGLGIQRSVPTTSSAPAP